MSEILFRGKGIKTKTWVYGDLQQFTNENPTIYRTYEDNDEEAPEDYRCPTEVFPDSVGQYIGIEDKNNTKIFKGDIIEISFILVKKRKKITERIETGEVVFKDGAYIVVIYDKGEPITIRRFDEIQDYQVIGNTFDNPELKKVKDKKMHQWMEGLGFTYNKDIDTYESNTGMLRVPYDMASIFWQDKKEGGF